MESEDGVVVATIAFGMGIGAYSDAINIHFPI